MHGAKTAIINDHSAFRVDWMPFGGRNILLSDRIHTLSESAAFVIKMFQNSPHSASCLNQKFEMISKVILHLTEKIRLEWNKK